MRPRSGPFLVRGHTWAPSCCCNSTSAHRSWCPSPAVSTYVSGKYSYWTRGLSSAITRVANSKPQQTVVGPHHPAPAKAPQAWAAFAAKLPRDPVHLYFLLPCVAAAGPER
eukprot:scaffold2551_cov376-Prasinococcus_capsulatus_cf.AAC.5